jgi:amidase
VSNLPLTAHWVLADSVSFAHSAVLAGEGRSAFLSEYAGSKELLDPLIVSHVENSTGVTRAQQLEAYDEIAKLRPIIDSIASKYTALVTPSTTDEAPLLEEPLRFTGDAVSLLSASALSSALTELSPSRSLST